MSVKKMTNIRYVAGIGFESMTDMAVQRKSMENERCGDWIVDIRYIEVVGWLLKVSQMEKVKVWQMEKV